jgi:hypothetical protein
MYTKLEIILDENDVCSAKISFEETFVNKERKIHANVKIRDHTIVFLLQNGLSYKIVPENFYLYSVKNWVDFSIQQNSFYGELISLIRESYSSHNIYKFVPRSKII